MPEEPASAGTISLLLLAAPGTLFVYFRSLFLAGRMPPLKEGFVVFASISVIYHSAMAVLIGQEYRAFLQDPVPHRLLLLLSLVVPSICGALSGLNARHGWLSSLFANLGLHTVHPIECAWDWHFSNCQESWVMIKLRDGTIWAGVLGTKSFLSSDPGERDLFLESVYCLKDDGTFGDAKDSSVWLSQSDIQSVELWSKAKES